MSFKQIPSNAGYFVCISGGSGITWNVSGDGTRGTVDSATIALGAQYIDLGVTRVVKSGSPTPVNAEIYRKVVPVTVPLDVNAAEKFIRIGGTSSNFARMG